MALARNFLMGMAVATPLIFTVGAIAPVQAAPLGGYTFTGLGNNTPTISDPNLTLTNFTGGSGLGSLLLAPIANGSTFTAGGWTTGNNRDANDFFSFTATVASGYQLSLNTLSLQLTRVGTSLGNAGSGAPRNWQIGASVGGGPLSILGSGPLDGVLFNNPNNISVGLASLGTVTSPVQFFIYGFRANNGFSILAADNVVLDGAVSAIPTPAIPTPAVLPAMIGFGAGIVRKRKAAKLAEAEV